MRNRVSKAFTLVEILIVVVILGILAAIVIPQFTNASQDAQRGNIQTQIQSIRNQIELFRVKNNGSNPVIVGTGTGAFADFLVNNANNSYGHMQQAYMRTAPVNPRNGSADVLTDASANQLATAAAAAAMDPTTTAGGWIFNPTTGAFAAVGFNETNNKWYGEP